MMAEPKVSVVIPTYNRVGLVVQAIESVLAQTFTDYEIIVVDDGSTDSTRQQLEPLIQANSVRYVFQENRGLAAARNHGFQLAFGKYIVFLDSDDCLMPQALEKQVACLDGSPEIGLVHGGYTKFDNQGRDLGYRDTSRFAGFVYPGILLEWSILMAVPTVMLRASVLAKVGSFDESMEQAEDLDMWRRIARRYRFRALPETLARIRYHEGSMSRDKARVSAGLESYLRKAFEEDPGLGSILRRRATAGLYANIGNTLLGRGQPEDMALVRRHCFRSMLAWPFQLRAVIGFIGSCLGVRLQRPLTTKWRQYRYRPRSR